MPASDEFKKALRSGDLPEAFVMAMGKATELKITTQVVKADGSIAAEYNPAQCLETRLDILNGTIENRVGEEFVGTGKYRELQQFHQQQVALGNRKIQENFQSLQQLFRLLVTLQQYNRITNAEKPLDLTFLEVPSQALPPEKVITTLQEQAAILETIAEVQSAASMVAEDLDMDFGLSEMDFAPAAAPAPTKDQTQDQHNKTEKIKLTAPPPPKVNRTKPVTEVQPTSEPPAPPVTDRLKKAAIATGTVAAAAAIAEVVSHPKPPTTQPSEPEETLGFLDSFSALDLDDTPEPLMPLSDVEMDDWETPIELTPAQRLSQMPSETYVPSLNDFDHDPTETEDNLDNLLADDDLDDLFEDETSTDFADDLGTVEETIIEPITDEIETVIEVAERPIEATETVDLAIDDIDDLPDFSGDELGELIDTTEDFAVAEAAVETTETVDFAADNLPNFSEGDFDDLIVKLDDLAAEESPVAAAETIDFATDDLPDFSGDDFGGLIDATEDFAVAEIPVAADETVDFATDDLPDFSGDDFGGLIDATEDFAVAEIPVAVDETVDFATDDLPDFSGDDFGGLIDATEDFAVAEIPVAADETVDFATDDLPDFSGDDFGGLIDATEDFAVAEIPVAADETVDFATDDLPDFSDDDFGGLIDATEDFAVAEIPVAADEMVDFATDDLPDFSGDDFGGLIDATEDFAVAEIPVEADETVDFATDDLPDFSGDDFGGLIDATEDFAVAEIPLEADETVDFATDDLPDFSGDDFGGLIDATEDFAVAEIPVEAAETVDFATDDLPDFSGDDFGGLIDATEDFAVAEIPVAADETVDLAADDFAVAESPIAEVVELVDIPESPEMSLTEAVETPVEPAQVAPVDSGSDLDNIDDSELLDFLGQDWRSNPEVAEIVSLEEDSGEPILIQPLTEEELATLEEVEDLEDDWQPIGESSDGFSGLQDFAFETDEDEDSSFDAAEHAALDGGDFDDDLDDDWQPLDDDAPGMSAFALNEFDAPDAPPGLFALELDETDDDEFGAIANIEVEEETVAVTPDEEMPTTDLDPLDMSDAMPDVISDEISDADIDFEASLHHADVDLSMAESIEETEETTADFSFSDETDFDTDLLMDDGIDDYSISDTNADLAMMEEERDAKMSGEAGSLGSLNDAIGNSDLDLEAFDASMDGLTDNLDDLDLEELEADASLSLGTDELDLLAEDENLFGVDQPTAIAPDEDSAANVLPDPFSEDHDNWLNDDFDPDLAIDGLDDEISADLNIDLIDVDDVDINAEDLDADLGADSLGHLDGDLDIGSLDLALDGMDDDELFSQDVMSSIQELDASTASLESENFDLSNNSLFTGLEEKTGNHAAEQHHEATLSPFSSDDDSDDEFDMDALVLESSLELNDFGDSSDVALADFSFTDNPADDLSAIAPDMIEDDPDMMDLDFDNFDSPIDLELDLDKDHHAPINDDWAQLNDVEHTESDDNSWDELQIAPTHTSHQTVEGSTDDWATDMGDLDALNDLEDVDLSGIGDFDLESIEADDGDSDFELFGEDSSEPFDLLLDP